MPTHERQPAAEPLTILSSGTIEIEGRMPWSSNGTFLTTVTAGDDVLQAVYKPHRGERPLWDFPEGLFLREVAAYELSAALGWDVVPETVLRSDGPLGVGSLQRFVPADFTEHYFTLLEAGTHIDGLQTIGTFDLVANNADRKSGHCLIDGTGHIWGIDNGLCFHAEPKLRTVIWDFAGEPVPERLLPDLERLSTDPLPALARLLSDDEVELVRRRAAAVVRRPVFPAPPESHRAYPWPLV